MFSTQFLSDCVLPHSSSQIFSFRAVLLALAAKQMSKAAHPPFHSFNLHRNTKPQNGLGWKGPQRSAGSTTLPWAGTPSTFCNGNAEREHSPFQAPDKFSPYTVVSSTVKKRRTYLSTIGLDLINVFRFSLEIPLSLLLVWHFVHFYRVSIFPYT